MDKINLDPIRSAFERSEYGHDPHGVSRIAHDMEMDKEQVRRLLGHKPGISFKALAGGERRRYTYTLLTCKEETAMKFAAALGLDPYDLGF
jgi:methylphosphotriester-DNA--protein-cysteine methyltransferase